MMHLEYNYRNQMEGFRWWLEMMVMVIILYIIPSVYGFHKELFLSILRQFRAVIVKRTCGDGCLGQVRETVNGLT